MTSSIRAWLDSSRLAWPGTLHFDVDVIDALEPHGDPREVFPQADLGIQAGPPDGTIRVRWQASLAEAIVHATKAHAAIRMTREAITRFETAERGFLLVALLFMLRRVGWYHVHCAAMIDPQGRGWLLAGQSHSGKSTTSALLARQGWSVSTDDIGFLSDNGVTVGVEGFWSPIALREGGRTLLGPAGGVELSRRAKTGFNPEELGGHWIARVTPEVVLFTSIGTTTSITPIAPGIAIKRLIESSIWVLFETVHAQEHLELLARVATQSRAFDATLGPDLFLNPDLFQDLVP
ncbi:MAG: hypothetical protein ABIR59_03770 [Gemmatimonadales bacterium]